MATAAKDLEGVYITFFYETLKVVAVCKKKKNLKRIFLFVN